jgi:SHS family lactate transporter-like MFS transporter
MGLLGAFLIQFLVQSAWGVIPAHLSELSGDSVRGFLPGFTYQCGTLLSSYVVYVEPVLAGRMSFASAMALTAATVFALGAVVTAVGREHKGKIFGVAA